MKNISIDNGNTYSTPEDTIAAVGMDVIVHMMDDDTRRAVDAMGVDNDVDFLVRYLQIADDDLIIG